MSRRSSKGNTRESSSSSSDMEVVHHEITKEELLNPSQDLFEDRPRRRRNNSTTTEDAFSDFERVSEYGGRHFYVSDLSQEERRKLRKQLEEEMSDSNFDRTTRSDEGRSDEEDEKSKDTDQNDVPDSISEAEQEDFPQESFLSKIQKNYPPIVLSIIRCPNLSIEEKLLKLEEYLKMRELKECEKYLKNQEMEDPQISSEEGEINEGGEEENTENAEEIPTECEEKREKELESDDKPKVEEKTRKDELIKWLEDELEETQEAFEREKETSSQLREQLTSSKITIDMLEKRNAALEEVIDKEAGKKSAREKLLEEENRKKNEEISVLEKEMETNRRMTAELLKNVRHGKSKELLRTREEDEFLRNRITPFPFLENVDLETVQIIHKAIQKYENVPQGGLAVEAVLHLFLREKNRNVYTAWRQEKIGKLPKAFSFLSMDQRAEIMDYINRDYTLRTDRGEFRTRHVFRIAQDQLQKFLEIKKRIELREAENKTETPEKPVENFDLLNCRSSKIAAAVIEHNEKQEEEPRMKDQTETDKDLFYDANDVFLPAPRVDEMIARPDAGSTKLASADDFKSPDVGEQEQLSEKEDVLEIEEEQPHEEEEDEEAEQVVEEDFQQEEEREQEGELPQDEEMPEAERQKIITTMPFLTHVSTEDLSTALELIENCTLSIEKKLEYLEDYLTVKGIKQCEEYLRNRERIAPPIRRQIPERPGFRENNCLLLDNPITFCFANVVVQTIYRLWRRPILNYRGDHEIFLELQRIVTGRGEVDVRRLLRIVSAGSQFTFDNGAQHDAQEFWTELFNQLPPEYQQLFALRISKRYTCIDCNHETTSSETENLLIIKNELELGAGLDEYLRNIEGRELIEDKECVNCPMDEEKYSTHDHWCEPLLGFDSTSSQFIALRVELRRDVQFGSQNFIDRQMIADDEEYEAFDCLWRPVAMIEHIGCEFSHRGGHYVVYLKNSEGWLNIDDMAIEAQQLDDTPAMKRICFIILKRI